MNRAITYAGLAILLLATMLSGFLFGTTYAGVSLLLVLIMGLSAFIVSLAIQKEVDEAENRGKAAAALEMVKKVAENAKAVHEDFLASQPAPKSHKEELEDALYSIMSEVIGEERPPRTNEIEQIKRLFNERTGHFAKIKLEMGGMAVEIAPTPFAPARKRKPAPKKAVDADKKVTVKSEAAPVK